MMGIFRKHAVGWVLAAGALLIANTSDAKVPVAPLKSATTVVQVAQGCGPGAGETRTAIAVMVTVTVMATGTVTDMGMVVAVPVPEASLCKTAFVAVSGILKIT